MTLPRNRRASGAARAHDRQVAATAVGGIQIPCTMVVFSGDRDVVALAERALPDSWKLERVQSIVSGREILSRPNVQLVVVDDESVPEDSKGWLLDHIRRFAPRALLIYVAASHSPDEEKRARAYAAQYYTAKPLDSDRTFRVIQSFLQARRA
jgi:DNA-binding NtrC family response regulator